MLHLNGQRSVLQRRSNISNALQALLDGTAVLGIAYWLIDRHLGFVSAPYTFMVVLLLGMLGLLYDQLALYRSNANFTAKALKLFQAWTLAFAALLALAEQYAGEDISERVAYFGRIEAELICSPDPQFRFHSGLPVRSDSC